MRFTISWSQGHPAVIYDQQWFKHWWVEIIHFRFDEKFFTFCAKELTKINTFYAEKLAEATRKFATLKSEMEDNDTDNVKGQKKIQRRKELV